MNKNDALTLEYDLGAYDHLPGHTAILPRTGARVQHGTDPVYGQWCAFGCVAGQF